jgi:two-component system response regulator DesR
MLRQDLPAIKVLMLSTYPYETYVRALFAIGVHGYMLKQASGPELLAAVRAVHAGNQALSAEIAAQRTGSAIAGALSDRELQALTLAFNEASNKEIAQGLGIGPRTVESYLRNAMAKLGARSRIEAITIALQRSVLILDDEDPTT